MLSWSKKFMVRNFHVWFGPWAGAETSVRLWFLQEVSASQHWYFAWRRKLGVTVNVVVTGELSCTAAGFTVVRFRLGTPACRPRLSPIFVIPVLLSEGSGAWHWEWECYAGGHPSPGHGRPLGCGEQRRCCEHCSERIVRVGQRVQSR